MPQSPICFFVSVGSHSHQVSSQCQPTAHADVPESDSPQPCPAAGPEGLLQAWDVSLQLQHGQSCQLPTGMDAYQSCSHIRTHLHFHTCSTQQEIVGVIRVYTCWKYSVWFAPTISSKVWRVIYRQEEKRMKQLHSRHARSNRRKDSCSLLDLCPAAEWMEARDTEWGNILGKGCLMWQWAVYPAFHMSRFMFEYVLQLINPALTRKITRRRHQHCYRLEPWGSAPEVGKSFKITLTFVTFCCQAIHEMVGFF